MAVGKLLLTGFEKFLSFPTNPSEEVAKRLKGRKVGKYQCDSITLPVDFEESVAILSDTLEKGSYDLALSLGLAYSREVISLERVALNLIDDGVRKNNKGRIIEDKQILSEGVNAYFASLPLKKIQLALNEAGLKSELSLSAGSYVCNLVMYHLLHFQNTISPSMLAGFIHIPPDASLKRESKWTLDQLEEAIHIVINNC